MVSLRDDYNCTEGAPSLHSQLFTLHSVLHADEVEVLKAHREHGVLLRICVLDQHGALGLAVIPALGGFVELAAVEVVLQLPVAQGHPEGAAVLADHLHRDGLDEIGIAALGAEGALQEVELSACAGKLPRAGSLGILLSHQIHGHTAVDADIVLANDPDADRIGVYARKAKGEYVSFTGNMSAELLLEYELSEKKKKGLLPEGSCIITTIVSTDMAKAMAKAYGIKEFETLTGFKWIGKKIREFEEENSYKFQFGFEESYGCIISDHARDKDGISAVMATCEAAAFYKAQGLSLVDQMKNIYKKYGYYKEGQIAVVLKGVDGAKEIKDKMEKMRNNPPKELAGLKVLEVRDYEKHEIVKANGEKGETDLPTSNVLYYELENNSWACVRPSGTEPKIKFYMGVKGNSDADADEKLAKLKEAMQAIV